MLDYICFLLFGIEIKEVMGAIATNLLSDFMSIKINDRKSRRSVCKFKRKLYIWVSQFQKKNEDTVIGSGIYLEFLKNYRIIDRIYEYVFSVEEKQISEGEFLGDLVTRSVAYIQNQGKSVGVMDESVLRDFYEKLLERIKKFCRNTDGFKQQTLLYQLNQVRLGNCAIYEELVRNSTLTAKSHRKIDQMYLEIVGLLRKNGPDLNETWFEKQNTETILNMGNRYIPELNVELPIQKEIEIMSADKDFFSQLLDKCNDLMTNMNKIRSKDVKMQQFAQQLTEILPKLQTFEEFNNYKKNIKLLILDVKNYVEGTLQQIEEVTEEKMDNIYFSYMMQRNYFMIQKSVDELGKYLCKNTIQLLEYPFLMIHGKGGVGKSHLLAATVEERRRNGKSSILLLGQDFPEACIIWHRIRDLLKIEMDEDSFLLRLNGLAEEKNSRILLILDAINEGGGRELWKDRLAGFVRKIEKYPYLGFVFSIRDEFMEEMTPQNLLDRCHITKLAHVGFGADTIKAVEVFFAHYDIKMSVLPYLPREFSNGLFLRLFCEGHQAKTKENIKLNTGEIYRNYLQSLNKKLADRYQYSRECDFVGYVLQKFVEESYGVNVRNKLSRNQASGMVFSLAGNYGISTKIYDDLLAEGVLSQSIEENEEYVFITYERLADYIFVQSKIKDVINHSRSDEDLVAELYRPGVWEELACMLPEYGIEIFERFPKLAGKLRTVRAELDSITWRLGEKLDPQKIINYVGEYVMPDQAFRKTFWESVIWVSTNERHPFNALFFHRAMMNITMAERDAVYMPLFLSWRDEQSPISFLLGWIDRVDDGKSAVADEHIYLCAIVLSWMLCVTDIHYRDQVSAALCRLLRGHGDVLMRVLKQFEQVDDVYIQERIYAVALGVVTFECNQEVLNSLAYYVYETIFDQATVVTDILIRDSAREIILYVNHIQPNNDIDLQKVIGPYHSKFPEIPSLGEIEGYRSCEDTKKFREAKWAHRRIFSSMQIDDRNHYYGDFGRYIFQRYFNYWKELRADNLMRIAIKDIFQRGYDADKHGRFDYDTDHYERIQTNKVERIGKKYQWQALYKLAAQVSDQFKYENKATGEMEYNVGAFEPALRDFDPTVNDKSFIGKYGELAPVFTGNYEMENRRWMNISDDCPDFEKWIYLILKDQLYIGLSAFWDWDEPTIPGDRKYDYPMKNVWFMSQAYIIREEDFELCKSQLESADFWGRWMPEDANNYMLYNREYYWSDVHQYFENEYYGGSEWQQIQLGDCPELADVSFLVPTYSYLSTGEREFQNIKHGQWKKPCKTLYQACNLNYGPENTVMYDKDNKIMCFDTVEIFGKERGFFFHKKELEKFLVSNHYRIFWQLLGEKRIIGGSYGCESDCEPLEYTGFYYLEDGKLCGSMRVVEDTRMYS